jgi:hypothetical protein
LKGTQIFRTNVVDDLAASSANQIASYLHYDAGFLELIKGVGVEANYGGASLALVPFVGSGILLVKAGRACHAAITGG